MSSGQSGFKIGGIVFNKDTLLKDVLEAVYQAGKAEGHSIGFNDGYKQRKSDEADEVKIANKRTVWNGEEYQVIVQGEG